MRGLESLPAARAGAVALVGAGPGDPGLLTLRAARLLATADVVAHDRLVPPEVLAMAGPAAELRTVGKAAPGVDAGQRGWRQEEIHELLIAEARAGRAVVRLKGGDPYVFGRGGEEMIACHQAGVPVEVVPGISAATAAPSAAGIPVTHRGVAASVAFVAGHEDPSKPAGHLDWPALAAFPGTLVFLMGVGSTGRIATQLRRHGRAGSTPAALVRWASTDQQQELVSDLDHLEADVRMSGLRSPATIVVGEVVALREAIAGELPALAGAR